MHYWCSANAIHASLQNKLQGAGLLPISSKKTRDINANEVLFIYSPPHKVLEKLYATESTAIKRNDILRMYSEADELAKKYQNCACDSRLNALDNTSINRLRNNETPQIVANLYTSNIKPLTGLVTWRLLTEEPKILDIYLNLELNSILFGLEPDINYIQRLKKVSSIDIILGDWSEIKNLDREASLEEVSTNLTRILQIQGEYDQLFIQNQKLLTTIRKQRRLRRLFSMIKNLFSGIIELALIRFGKTFK
jgi:hypothetical protein